LLEWISLARRLLALSLPSVTLLRLGIVSKLSLLSLGATP